VCFNNNLTEYERPDRVTQFRSKQGNPIVLAAGIPLSAMHEPLETKQKCKGFPTYTGMHFINHVNFDSNECNCVQTEHGFVVARYALKQETVLGMDRGIIIDHRGQIVYQNKEKTGDAKNRIARLHFYKD